MNNKRCNHDGGTCHHHCELGECFRAKTCLPLTTPHDGYPKVGKYEAKVESVRTVSIEWSGAIFDTPEQARNWGQRIKRQWASDGVDPDAIRVEVAKTDRDESTI